jgi:hypothetical protein
MAANPSRLSPPGIYLLRMVVFLTLVGFLALFLYREIYAAFWFNPFLNGVIGGVLFIGIVLALRQVGRLFAEVRWINNARSEDPKRSRRPPTLLAPVAALLGERLDQPAVSMVAMRSILDSLASRLDENRDIVRYLAGLLIFLGLLGTFWGLLETVSKVGQVIQSLRPGTDAGAQFNDLKTGLAAPLGGMGISFSSSLFGLAGSLIVGFLDLQAGQAQNRFYTELEDWLTANVSDVNEAKPLALPPPQSAPDVSEAIERLTSALADAGGGRASAQAMASLAEGIQGLVQHMRAEQQLIRDWVEAQADQQREIRRVLERLAPGGRGSREKVSS